MSNPIQNISQGFASFIRGIDTYSRNITRTVARVEKIFNAIIGPFQDLARFIAKIAPVAILEVENAKKS